MDGRTQQTSLDSSYQPLQSASDSTLELHNFNLSPQIVRQTMQHLVKLTLIDCRSTGGFRDMWETTWKECLTEIAKLPALKSLHLAGCSLHDEHLLSIYDLLGLEELTLDRNLLTSEVSLFLNRLKSLKFLSLNLNNIYDCNFLQVLVKQLPQLRVLHCRFEKAQKIRIENGLRKISDLGLFLILSNLPNLHDLALNYGKVSLATITPICLLKQLTTLALEQTSLNDSQAIMLAEHMPQLQHLNLYFNEIGSAGAKAISKHLCRLNWLSITCNKISDEGAYELSRGLPLLQHLEIANCALYGEGLYFVCQLQHIRLLDIRSNKADCWRSAFNLIIGLQTTKVLKLNSTMLSEYGLLEILVKNKQNLQIICLDNSRLARENEALIRMRLKNTRIDLV